MRLASKLALSALSLTAICSVSTAQTNFRYPAGFGATVSARGEIEAKATAMTVTDQDNVPLVNSSLIVSSSLVSLSDTKLFSATANDSSFDNGCQTFATAQVGGGRLNYDITGSLSTIEFDASTARSHFEQINGISSPDGGGGGGGATSTSVALPAPGEDDLILELPFVIQNTPSTVVVPAGLFGVSRSESSPTGGSSSISFEIFSDTLIGQFPNFIVDPSDVSLLSGTRSASGNQTDISMSPSSISLPRGFYILELRVTSDSDLSTVLNSCPGIVNSSSAVTDTFEFEMILQ